MEIIEAISGRAATRAFLDRPVERDRVEAILEAARWAPSGVNIQPWQVAVVTGKAKQTLTEALIAAHRAGKPAPDYRYYPEQWFDPFKERRKRCGLALYQALAISRDEADRQQQAWEENYRFFGAPVGLLLFLDRRLGQGAWIDIGMFMQNIMLAARAFGLATCPQASLADYPDIVRRQLALPQELLLVGGLSLGYPDPEAPVNRYRTEREPVAAFTRWYA